MFRRKKKTFILLLLLLLLLEKKPSLSGVGLRTIQFVRYGCIGKTPIPYRLQIYKLTAVIFMAINRIETVNFSRITALYRYTGGQSIISLFWVQYHTKHMKIIYFFYYKLMKLVAKL